MENSFLLPDEAMAYEPARENGFILQLLGLDVNISSYLIRNYKLYNNGDELVIETEMMETIDHMFNPRTFFDITDILIQHLDPVGLVVYETKFKIKKSNFEKYGNYDSDKLSKVNFTFIVDVEYSKPINIKPESN